MIATTPAQKFIGGAILVLSLAVGVQTLRLNRERNAKTQAEFRTDSLEAAIDTTRAVNARAAKVLGPDSRGVELRAIQLLGLKVDALDKAVGRISVAKTSGTTTVRPIVDVQGTAAVTTDTVKDERKATFVVDSTPYHAKAEVALPRIGAGRIGLSIRTDTAHFASRFQCGKAKAGGVKPASVLLDGPNWLPFTIDNAQVDQSLCNPQEKESLWLLWLGIGTAGGIAIDQLVFK